MSENLPSMETDRSPAVYLYGDTLQATQEANRAVFSDDGPYLYGRFVAENLQRAAQYDNYFSIQTDPNSSALTEAPLQDSTAVSSNPYLKSVDHWLNEARGDLQAKGFEVNSLDDEVLKERLVKNYHRFVETAERRQPELLKAKDSFAARMHQAIDEQGLPISHEQLEQRLAGVRMGFLDPLERPHTGGDFSPISKRIRIAVNVTEEDLIHNVYHELLHSISGNRQVVDNDKTSGMKIRKIGLEQPNKSRLWLNEAITDLLPNILLDPKGKKWDLGSRKSSILFAGLSSLYGIVARLPDSQKRTYLDYKQAAMNVLWKIPARTLMRAYFAQDQDSFESDPLAGTHAERDLQRSIKVTGGIQRIAKLRLIDQAFQTDDHKTAEKESKKIEKWDVSDRAMIGRTINRHKVARHTRKYQTRIEQAKKYVASRGET